MNGSKMKVFSGRANRALAERVVQCLGDTLGALRIENFPDGETWVRVEEDVRGRDVFVIQPTCTPVNEHIMELLVILDALKRASAARVTAVLPYYGYARQDRKDQGRVPISAKLVADVLEAAGADRVIAMDLHSPQIQGFFDIPVDNLTAAPVIRDYVRSLGIPPRDFVVLSPDEGSIKKALNYQKQIGGAVSIVDKRRIDSTQTKQANIIGAPLEGKTVVVFDDMISTAGTLVGAANAARLNGAKEIYACATHGVLCGPAIQRLRDAPFKLIAVTDTIPLPPDKQLPNIKVLSIAPLLADAIKRVHDNESVSKLFE